MSVFTSLIILIPAMLIIACLKLIPGIFGLFYHYASGKYSAKKVSDLSIFFILGVEVLPAILFILLNLILLLFSFTNINFSNRIFLWVISGLLTTLALCFFTFYFRKGDGTRLFISRNLAKNFDKKSRSVKTRSDAFILGFMSGIPELIFTLPLYFISFIEVSKNYFVSTTCAALLTLFILIIISPLFFIYAHFKTGNNLATFERQRTKNKSFFRFFIPILYIMLAVLIIIFKAIL